MGGVVIEGMPFMRHHGTELTFVGAKVVCPACKTTGHIVPKGPRWPDNLMGKHAALEGDLCVCKCHPTPIMLASQSDMVETFEAHELAKMGFASNGAPLKQEALPDFDEQVRVLDSEGRPLSNVPYHIKTRSGAIHKGLTDSQGRCHRVYTAKAEALDIAIGYKALERWNS